MPKQLSALFVASFLVNLANAAISTMLGILIATGGGSQGDVSFIAAAYSIGFGLGCFAAPNLARRSGVIRTYAAAAAIATITIIGLEALDNTLAWAALRFVMGAAIATVLAVSDTWINYEAPKDRRGQVIALYSIVLGLASIGSQLVFLWMGSDAESLILYFAALMNIAVAVIAVTKSEQPVLPPATSAKITLNIPSPTAGAGAFVSGFSATSIISVLPFYLTSHGLSVSLVAIVIMLLYGGRLFAQWPVGILSDRVDRRLVIISLAIPAILVMIAAAVIGDGEGRAFSGAQGSAVQVLAFLAPFLCGAAIFPLYSVSSALAFDRSADGTTTEVSSTLLLLYSIGSVVGPTAVMIASTAIGDYALQACVGAANLALIIVAFLRLSRIKAPEDPSPSVPVPENSLKMVQEAGKISEEEVQDATPSS
ncbi:MFS transporter [Roseibium sp.]|uniref:MFS transporter n=1 Tax=Roseibium sp. TaxID=1936156 RepID=UPI003B5010C0